LVADLDEDEYLALAEFRLQLRRFLQFSEEAARAAGIEPRQHQLLLTVRALPPHTRPTIGEIAGRMMLKHHSTVELIDRLESRDLVARKHDPNDARAVLIRLTPRGRSILRRLSVAHRTELGAQGQALAAALKRLTTGAEKK
jgi:DNA-binding MarR family transcriptional regulator